MSKSNLAFFAKDIRTASVQALHAYELTGGESLATGKPNNTQLLMTAGPEGALVTSLYAIASGTHTATQAALFIRRASEPAEQRTLLTSIHIIGQGVTATSPIPRHVFDIASDAAPLRLGAGDELYFGIAIPQADGIFAHALYTDF